MRKNILKYHYAIWLLVTFFVISSCKSKTQVEVSPKPNVIIVITDDQGYGDMGHTGNPIVKTPAIDKFAADAVNLTNYHVGTTCSPTRAGLLTGRNCNRNGVWHTIMGASMLNKDEVTLADVLKESGYSTGMFGKWHLGDNHPFLPHERGFDLAFYHGGGGIGQTPDYWNNDYFDDTYFRNGNPEKMVGYCTDVWFDEAMKYIEEKKSEPFFCYLSLNAPHSPFNVPEEYYNLYKEEQNILESQKRFYGMITNIDDNFSKLLSKLEELGIEDNTIVIFTSDNGTSNGYKVDKGAGQVFGYNAGMRGTKASQYEGGHRVPFIIRWPDGGIVGGESLSELMAHVDFLPTLTSLTNIEFKSSKIMDGMDLSEYLLHNKKPKDRMLVTDTQRVPWPVKGKQSCVMSGMWRLINGDELYNVSEDPGQKNNVADLYPERVAAMNDFYNNWWGDVISETKYSVIDIDSNKETLTCHDTHTVGYFPPWNQKLIRQGKFMKPAKLLVNFMNEGKYRFSLRRWPAESGLSLGQEAKDIIPETLFSDARVYGAKHSYRKAYLKIGDIQHDVEVNNEAPAAVFELEVTRGETELWAWFETEDGSLTNAFYIDAELVN